MSSTDYIFKIGSVILPKEEEFTTFAWPIYLDSVALVLSSGLPAEAKLFVALLYFVAAAAFVVVTAAAIAVAAATGVVLF
eukprot:6635448-Ditylum_brightwellii.AAC.1